VALSLSELGRLKATAGTETDRNHDSIPVLLFDKLFQILKRK
jgi:hypothetical protein